MTTKIIKGSLNDVASKNKSTLAESFMHCSTLILADMSSSMSTKDAPGNMSRYAAAEKDIVRLQETHEGKIALVVFSNHTEFCPSGVPKRLAGGTDMVKALEFIKPVDDTGVKIIMISDGEPNDAQATLVIARQFKTPIQTIYCGPENDFYGGREFLQLLASKTGGEFVQSDAPGLLADGVERLMLTG